MSGQRIGLVSSAVPHVLGGGRFIVEWLGVKLRAAGHDVETIFIPCDDEPDTLLEQAAVFRAMTFDDFDAVVTFRPPSHLIRHPRKICWFIHHIRAFYDMWETDYNPWPRTARVRALRDAVRRLDTIGLSEAHRCFALSGIVADRINTYNGFRPGILYAPLLQPELLRCDSYGDEIVCVSRVEHHKRQHLLIEAMRHVRTPVRLRLSGASSNPDYVASLTALIAQYGLQDRVTFDHRWISEQEKLDLLASCLAAAYAPYNEDYGYPTLEAAWAEKCTVTARDSGGVAEIVQDGRSGHVVEPSAEAVAGAFDRLYQDRALSARLGKGARERIADLGINWPTVLDRLLS
jgi:glycosyltransferase involved in cell wall biosynthesis